VISLNIDEFLVAPRARPNARQAGIFFFCLAK
jgi:hypothetical protein